MLSASCLFTATQVLVWEELELVVAGAGEDKDINLSQDGVEVAKIGLGIDSRIAARICRPPIFA